MLPEYIAGYHWSLFVDPAIDQEQLKFVAQALQGEYEFLNALLSGEPQPQQDNAQLQNNEQARANTEAKMSQEQPHNESYSAAP